MPVRTLGFADFTEFATAAMAGSRPYPYQQRLAAEGLPDLLHVPTGAGKTAAAVLTWLWRRMSFPRAVHDRLVYVLPGGSMIEQNGQQITTWLERLGLAATVPVVMLSGGEPGNWRLYPRHPAILLGTQDMVISRLLMRGYGECRASAPVTFGLLHCSSQFVFDDAALFGPALPTSLQLQGLRSKLGTASPCATMWTSATAGAADLASPDYAGPARIVELGQADRADERLARLLAATRTVRHVNLPDSPDLYPAALARALVDWHVPGTATIAVLNTAERAVAVYDALEKTAHAAELLLLHACFRPQERSAAAELLASPVLPAGRIVVATQVLEAGVDTSCRTMFTELAPWGSIVQRAGRCNRANEQRAAVLRWAPPPGNAAAPYKESSMADAVSLLGALEGMAVTSGMLQDVTQGGARREPAHAGRMTLRREDLVRLFDTAPPDPGDSGADITPWVSDGAAATALVGWRFWPDGEPAVAEPAPGRDELCPVPVAALRSSMTPYWIWDQIDGRWRRCADPDIGPGTVVLADAAGGGYAPRRGWSPTSIAAVPVVTGGPAGLPAGRGWQRAGAYLDAIDRDPACFTGAWVDLRTHLADTERELRALTGDWCSGHLPGQPPEGTSETERQAGLAPDHLEAAALAARFHDIGKAFSHFQEFLLGGTRGGAPGDGPWAKSPARGGRHKSRPHLRHELITALALLHPRCGLLDNVPEPDLVVYLAAAHQGKVRLAVRPLPGESDHDPPRILGVQHGDVLPPVTLGNGTKIPALTLDTRVLGVTGGATSGRSWASRVMALLERPGLGPFRLAFLEALLRVADWRASQAPSSDGGSLPRRARRPTAWSADRGRRLAAVRYRVDGATFGCGRCARKCRHRGAAVMRPAAAGRTTAAAARQSA